MLVTYSLFNVKLWVLRRKRSVRVEKNKLNILMVDNILTMIISIESSSWSINQLLVRDGYLKKFWDISLQPFNPNMVTCIVYIQTHSVYQKNLHQPISFQASIHSSNLPNIVFSVWQWVKLCWNTTNTLCRR